MQHNLVGGEIVRRRIMITLGFALAHLQGKRDVCKGLIAELRGMHFMRYGLTAPRHYEALPLDGLDKVRMTVLGRAIYNLERLLYAHLEKPYKEEGHGHEKD